MAVDLIVHTTQQSSLPSMDLIRYWIPKEPVTFFSNEHLSHTAFWKTFPLLSVTHQDPRPNGWFCFVYFAFDLRFVASGLIVDFAFDFEGVLLLIVHWDLGSPV
ncbi:hypothetical protein RJT34_16432 [Clitoria ternatea]|uniref:Uncharacterized protein n=1 Tax=Clitoria ternatea TaxID=43366 RepID=A0AAN9J8C2_CLITE